jgi:hypothetical protein
MGRAAIVVTVFAVLLNGLCVSECLTKLGAQPTPSCHHSQKKNIEPCTHRFLIAETSTPADQNPLAAAVSLAPVSPDELSTQSRSLPLTLSPSPPLLSPLTTILKI